ncbi:hypothetical protein HRI96_03955 [Treponema parvum]|uniref:Lipoprotein n=1 Tax=Treponema parvum TaxID=138851 RepID=A0A975EYT7_9SPIR|nr:TRAP transporter TatT component family protein [Treponema parvum]QTQ11426.1 hypothetical protein HRI96_03955 [Treponema parvum]QTQ16633.1 hypothetical protein HXT04_07990 [Treponema parvum]
MIKKICIFEIFLFFLFFTSCSSLKKIGTNAVSDMLAGADKNGCEIQKKAGSANPLTAVTGESDTVLIADFFPSALKVYEIMQAGNPEHGGLSVMCGQLNVMYANAFVQGPADLLSVENFDKKDAEYRRAEMHYMRGSDYVFSALDRRYKGFSEAVLSGEEEIFKPAISKLKKSDVNAAYWAAAGRLGAFSLDPLNPDLLKCLGGLVALLEKASELSPDYSDGAVWSLLFVFYVSAPADFGGNLERGLYCYREALRVSGGKNAGHYVGYAESYCIPQNDEEGFVNALKAALAIDPDKDPSNRLMTIIYQNKARRLLASQEDYFLHW